MSRSLRRGSTGSPLKLPREGRLDSSNASLEALAPDSFELTLPAAVDDNVSSSSSVSLRN